MPRRIAVPPGDGIGSEGVDALPAVPSPTRRLTTSPFTARAAPVQQA